MLGDILGERRLCYFHQGLLMNRGTFTLRFLFASAYTIHWLEQAASKIETGGLLTLFPNLVVAMTRTAPVQENKVKDQSLFPAFFGRLSRARIYHPIIPSSFMTDVVIGTEQRLVEISEELAYLSRHKGQRLPIPQDKRRDWARIHLGWYWLNSLQEIQFAVHGRFLPETQEGAYTFPLEGLHRHYSLKITFHKSVEMSITNLSADQASIMKCNLRGVLSLFPPTNDKNRRRSLPSLYLPKYYLPIGDIMREVFLGCRYPHLTG
jgi:hypothetical protein